MAILLEIFVFKRIYGLFYAVTLFCRILLTQVILPNRPATWMVSPGVCWMRMVAFVTRAHLSPNCMPMYGVSPDSWRFRQYSFHSSAIATYQQPLLYLPGNSISSSFALVMSSSRGPVIRFSFAARKHCGRCAVDSNIR